MKKALMILLLGASFIALAQSPNTGQRWRDLPLADLNLSATQQAAIQAIIDEHPLPDQEAQRAMMQAQQTEIHTLIQSDDFNQQTLDALIERQSAVRKAHQRERVIMAHEIWQVLDDQQRRQANALQPPMGQGNPQARGASQRRQGAKSGAGSHNAQSMRGQGSHRQKTDCPQ